MSTEPTTEERIDQCPPCEAIRMLDSIKDHIRVDKLLLTLIKNSYEISKLLTLEVLEAVRAYAHSMEGFSKAVRLDTGLAYPWPGGEKALRKLTEATTALRTHIESSPDHVDPGSSVSEAMDCADAHGGQCGHCTKCLSSQVEHYKERLVEIEKESNSRRDVLMKKAEDLRLEWVRAENAESLLAAERKTFDEVLRVLGEIYDAYEDGIPCYQEIDDDGHGEGYLGVAIQLSEEQDDAICALLNKYLPRAPKEFEDTKDGESPV